MEERFKGAIAGLILLLPLVFFGGLPFVYSVAITAIVAMYEFMRMAKISFDSIEGGIGVVMLLATVIPEHYLPLGSSETGISYLFYICCMLLLTVTVYKPQRFTASDAGLLALATLYIGTGFHYLIVLREYSFTAILYLFIIVWSTDVGAYLIGRQFGKIPLAPQVSPNKTVEGFLGGMISALIVGLIYNYLFSPFNVPIKFMGPMILCVSLMGQLGDLVESAYKRHFNVKDSGSIIPGHGGILDRFDSTLFAATMMMVWINIF